MAERKFINGAYLKKVYDKNDSLLIGFGFIKDKFIAELQALQPDERGFVNLTIGTQKNDKSKYSIWLDDRERGPGGQPASSQQQGYRPAPKQSTSYADTQQGPPNGAASYGSGPGPIDLESLPF